MARPWVREYVGVPFRDRGRDARGWDCWGLVRYVLEAHFGRFLPALDSAYESALDEDRVAELVDSTRPLVGAVEVAAPADGDVAVMSYAGLPCHVGVYLDGSILHVSPRTGTVLERVDSPRLRGRVKGYYRV